MSNPDTELNPLDKDTRLLVASWIYRGLTDDEIAAEAEGRGFSVSPSWLMEYRDDAVREYMAAFPGRFVALSEPLVNKEVRIRKLAQLARILERQIERGQLWTNQTRHYANNQFESEDCTPVFNAALSMEYRKTLADIAAEVGDRRAGMDVSITQTSRSIHDLIVTVRQARDSNTIRNDKAEERNNIELSSNNSTPTGIEIKGESEVSDMSERDSHRTNVLSDSLPPASENIIDILPNTEKIPEPKSRDEAMQMIADSFNGSADVFDLKKNKLYSSKNFEAENQENSDKCNNTDYDESHGK